MAETLQQTQTLSLRISEVLRKRLEDIRKLTALRENGVRDQNLRISPDEMPLLERPLGENGVRDQNSGFPLTRCLC